jgi:hypothetical protein
MTPIAVVQRGAGLTFEAERFPGAVGLLAPQQLAKRRRAPDLPRLSAAKILRARRPIEVVEGVIVALVRLSRGPEVRIELAQREGQSG